MQYFAHSSESESDDQWQPLDSHLTNVAILAACFASSFSAANWGEAAGLLHDLGKYSEDFQKRLRGGPRVDHSTAGAQEAVRLFGNAAGKLLAYALAGHHGGLPDGIKAGHRSLAERLLKRIPSYQHYPDNLLDNLELHNPPLNPSNHVGFQISFFLRAVFSCLVDADYLDTERFYDATRAGWRGGRPSPVQLKEKLAEYLIRLRSKASEAPLNCKRNEILQACLGAAEETPGLFSLTVPTGGGKTISSLAFALKHAVNNHLDRVVYVIPYTSIIEQTALEFRRILGDEAVLEHHSNLPVPDAADDKEYEKYRRARLASENWDAPLVVTTNVQFFESLFANRPSRCRKLHNMVRSVIILDEAQMLPREALLPCLEALRELVTNYGCTAVLCTATQPALNDADTFKQAALNPTEIAPEPAQLYKDFKRVEVVQEPDRLAEDALAERLVRENQVLCIVNTRRQAREVFKKLREAAGSEGCFHLSALMYPRHRSGKLDQIRACLALGKTCRVVSTQLIEAGVDVDFPVVWRALAGIDSLAQAAGRCNRENRLSGLGRVHVFEPEEGLPRGSLRAPAQEARSILRNYEDPLCLEAVRKYFENLFWQHRDLLDKKKVLPLLNDGVSAVQFKFAEAAREFSCFDSPGEAVLVCPDSKLREEIIQGLRHSEKPGLYLRKAQPYTVQLYSNELKTLEQSGEVEHIGEGFFPVLMNMDLYDDDLGLVVERSGQLSIEDHVL